MKIVDFVSEQLVIPKLQATTKQGVLSELAQKLATVYSEVREDELYRVLWEREVLASTAVGEGVAIPHGKLNAIGQLVACVARSEQGVSFDSIDGRPTHLFFALVAPENSTGTHLKALARISKLFKGDNEFREKLLAAPDAHAMFALISEQDART